MKRRDFLKYSSVGMAALVLGEKIPGVSDNPAYAQFPVALLDITITDIIKEMGTFNRTNRTAECYFWSYKVPQFRPDCPGPIIFATEGDTINLRIKNALDEPHAFSVPGMFDSGPIAPGATATFSFVAGTPGTHLYFDNLNSPVNRVMGLHGALVIMPAAPSGARWTPYASRDLLPQPGFAKHPVQQLFDDLGTGNPEGAAHWPGLAWEQGKASTLTPPFRQYVWLCHQASPKLFGTVGRLAAGQIFPAAEFMDRFLRDPFKLDNSRPATASNLPTFFTINGQSGHFCHNNPVVTAMARVGEPVLVRVLNAGLWSHAMHLHANHFYLLSVDGKVQGAPNPADPTLTGPGVIWADTYTLNAPGVPCSRYDMLIPYMRPPDIPNTRGIGRGGAPDAARTTAVGGKTYPPRDEFRVFMPAVGTTALSSVDGVTPVNLAQRQSPLCYPMHDHSEPSQTSQGGNYNTGLISGMYIIGDQNVPLNRVRVNDDPAGELLPPQTFPMEEDFFMMIFGNPTYAVYGIDEARRKGIMEPSKDALLDSQTKRPNFP